ncbi:HAD-superfamily subfamily IB hydrolase, TIGR01490 [Amycolatopsis arida]|uniref:HAD-superfamily subfamily IB hydrolase, TIGR01490 n=1 Tax=Amycolatopsis arida TaxID=587909 RepID=A0A1I5YAG3_9PSEU|nr:HAD superfamily hydrolase (TIGR01490 family) [Amycolatopsis arida]SFQ40907.1 HAD-superfamily subfamily IB hydrolase, TIGR01490 [Amycolatopsis arida]
MSRWRGRSKGQELERLAALAGEASADAAVAMEAVSAQLLTATEATEPTGDAGEPATESRDTTHDSTDGSAPAPPDLTAAAFFDVDNTMMMGASIFHFARGLAARKYFTTSDLAGFAWQQMKFRLIGREDPNSIKSSREQGLSFVAGRTVAEMNEVGEQIYDELMADKIWAGTRALAQMHLDAGQRVWLVTATPVELATIIARRLGLTGALGTVLESVDGVYTGRLVGDLLHGRAKAHAVRALAAREGLNLRRCTAYSDSSNDVPMLSVVGTAVAINPDAGLREIARNRHWEIRDFRTGRKAAKIGVPSVLGAGALAGAVAAGLAYRKRTA